MNEPQNSVELSDEQLERVYEQLVDLDSNQPVDEDVARARNAIEMIKRVRIAEHADTVRRIDTKAVKIGIGTGTFCDNMELPSRLGRFEIKQLVGKGGFGLVFLANEPNLGRDVALKIPRAHAINTPDLQRRFLREGRAAASLAHPNIVPVFESGMIGSVFFIASQFVPGETLTDFAISHAEELTPGTIAAIVGRMAEAMEHAHQRGVLHRDLKPSNILVESEGSNRSELADRIRITDFGLAKIESDQSETQTGAVIGTPLFMSPEQTVANSTVGQTSDIYSLGAILYHLLAGQPPFQKETRHDTITAVRNEEPKLIRHVKDTVPKDLEAICLKCLEKQPDKRYQTAFDLADDLSRFQRGEPVRARWATMLDRTFRWIKRNPMAAALFSVVLLGTVVVSSLLINSERLRLAAYESQQNVVNKTKQLQTAIDSLFLEIAATPELKLSGLDSLRRRMYFEASRLYENLVSEVPEDVELFLAFVETKLSFAKLTGSLGEKSKALEIVDGLLVDLEQQMSNQNLEDDERRQLVHAQVETLRLKLGNVANNEESNSIQDQVLRLIDSTDFLPVQFVVDRAAALSDVAGHATQTRDQVFAKQIIAKALEIWDDVPDEELANPVVLQELIGCYANAMVVASEQEDVNAGVPLAEDAVRLFELENVDIDELSPETVSEFSSILVSYGFLLRDSDIDKGLGFAADALEIITPIAQSHPAMADFQSRRCEVGYKHALLHFIKSDYEESRRLFHVELEESERLQIRFPEDPKFKSNTANCLWMLGLAYKRNFDFKNQLDIQKKSRAIIAANPERTPSIRTDLAGLDGEIGFSMAKLGDLEEGFETIVSAIDELKGIVDEDPANGQAKRFLHGNLEFASETARRLRRFDVAKDYFDAMIEIQGSTPIPKQMSAQIEIVVGLKDYPEATMLLEHYSNSIDSLRNADLFHDSKMFSHTLDQLRAEKQDSETNGQIDPLEESIVGAAINGLTRWLETSKSQSATLKRILEEPELETLKQYSEFEAMISSYSN